MNRIKTKLVNANRRKNRVRTTLAKNSSRPRLSIYVSNKNISAQVIDDSKQKTLVSATTITQKNAKATMTEKAVIVGKEIAKKAKAKKISEVSFDRGPRLYHGRIKALAEAAREEGLKF